MFATRVDDLAVSIRRRRDERSNGRVGTELEILRDDVEQWALISLFVTERPVRFSPFPLPRLMLLYAAYPVWIHLLTTVGGFGPPLVAWSDLFLGLR